MLKKFTQTDRHGNMVSKEMDGKFLKKKVMKDRYGNQMAFEFAIPESNVPPVNKVPQYSAEGGDINNHPGGPKGSDTVPAWLTPGEFVVNKEATDLFGDTIKQMNEIGRQIQDQKGAQEDGLKQVPNAVYANKGQAILNLENNPEWSKQLNHMLEKYKGPYFNKERLYEMMAGESSMTDTGEKYDEGSASGLFQITETPLKDMRRLGIVPKDFTTANIRAMNEVEQLKFYEKYLDMWGYKGNVHLGIMQAAPGAYTKAKNASKDGTVNPNDIAYKKGSEGYERNKNWIDKETGNLTFASIAKYSDSQSDNADIKNALAQIKNDRIPYGVNIGISPYASVPETQMAEAGITPPYGVAPYTPTAQVAYESPVSGAQSFAGVPSVNIPNDTALTTQPVPTDNFSANIPNYAAHTPEAEFLGIPLNQSNWDKGAEKRKFYRTAGQDYADEFTGLNPPPAVPHSNWDVGAERRNWQNNIGDTFANEFTGTNIQHPVTQADMQNFSGDIDAYIPKTPPVYPDAIMRTAENMPQPGTVSGSWPPSQDTSLYTANNWDQGAENRAAEAAKQQQYMDNFSPPELEKYIPNNFNIDDWSGSPGMEGWDKESVDKFGDEIEGINKWASDMVGPKDFENPWWKSGERRRLEKEKKEAVKYLQNESAKAAKLNDTINKTKNSNSPNENDKDKVIDTGNNASKAEQSKAMGFLKDMFGSLFNKQELKRMAVMYLGSRLLGYDHGGSLNFAAKNYIARVDALEASRLKFAHSDAAKNWDNVDEYVRTGDMSVMTPKGVTTYRQGVFEKWYNKKTRKEITVEKVHYGKGDAKEVGYVDVATGKPVSMGDYDKSGLYSARSKDRNEAIDKYTSTWTKILEDTKQAIITDIGQDNYDRVAGQLVLSNAASEALNEMLDKGADIGRAQEALSMALRLAVESENAKGKKALKIRSLKPALKALYVERGTGLGNLFKTRPDKRKEKDWDGVAGNKDFMDLSEFEKMRKNAAVITQTIPRFSKMNEDEAANLYLEDLAKLWAGVRRLPNGELDPDNLKAEDRKEYWMETDTNESGFFHFLRQQLILENEKRLGMK
tara:strand:+ start:1781 stop:4999 length:3219 start_codon:yes stop_codon:yes gene_type:complete